MATTERRIHLSAKYDHGTDDGRAAQSFRVIISFANLLLNQL